MSASVGASAVSEGLVFSVDPGSMYSSSFGLAYTIQRLDYGHPETFVNFNDIQAQSQIVDYGLHNDEINWSNVSALTRWGTRAKRNPSYLQPTDDSLTGWHFFSWSVSGQIYMPTAGTYSIISDGDDAFEMWVNGQIVSSWYLGHGFNGATIPINANIADTDIAISEPGWYPFMLRMTERTGGNGNAVGWRKPGDSDYSTIPLENFRPFSAFDKTGNLICWYFGQGPQTENNVLNCNGKNYIAAPTGTVLKNLTQITISQWAYMENWSAGGYQKIISNTNGGGFTISLNDSLTPTKLGGAIYINGSYRPVGIERSTVSSGWHHVAISFDGRYVKFYLDGNPVDSLDLGLGAFSIGNGTSSQLLLGAEPGATYGVETGGKFLGKVGITSIYNRGLSDAEVKKNFIASRSRYGV